MSGTRDTNWRSYVGPADNGRTITPAEWQAPANPRDWDDGVKGSRLHNFTVHGLTVPDFREDSIDFVQGDGYVVSECTVHGSITLKGGIHGYSIQDTAVAGTAATGTSAFFQNLDGTHNTYLQIRHSSEGVRLFNGTSFGGASNNLIFGNAATSETMRIDSSGNVGIGTTGPGDKLEIGGSGSGIILASPNGTRYRITVTNAGVLNVAAV